MSVDWNTAVRLTAGSAPRGQFSAGNTRSMANLLMAADTGDFDEAIASSKEAEALAKASIFQATSEKEAWKALEIR